MADVTGDGDDRGQLMLVSALAIAVLLVGLALTLNTAIYTENLATRTTDTNLDGAVNHGGAVEMGAGELLDEVNRDGGSYSSLTDAFDLALGNWSDTAATLTAVRGAVTNASRTDRVDGTRISQSDSTRDFTDRSGSGDWTLATDVGVRGVRFNVSRDSLATSSGSAFELVLDDGSAQVETEVYRDSTHVFVTVEDASGSRSTCSVAADSGDYVRLDVPAGELNGTACDPLDTVQTDLSGKTTVTYRSSTQAEGTYELFVNKTNSTVFDAAKYEPADSGSSPVAEEALYAVNVSYVYQTGETYVSREVRVAPGEIT
ncbi:hypothetical protein E6P09_08855 [Haloferax mediterranei ATCC 33500]|uniref:Uncharacterized protein n=1 Tax=Haloferax mediterranei (strain ATCC 33500 / DSM 1411 / JCM 8866 / NBRC 14739 / NCIMB 2177 / R-4) TaxID=523841 RepID=I3R3S1_HALMT|nr:hypothetical protein [Haloferax mediterranei]AFK18881.1 hypothetical protein HFX_1167 [Haloferax mediterranei ATCC 33500]AHZ21755.1 hypothetical protein BM92_03370 [Haloferax mediterranei ATCC 33500]EMA03260.1 hypothetical protein C439_04660 [Haloferax mediterranei ATCC 33500]MDX5988975.1 hypothetical protein [Haloferax mediterranei ATCC 33500]QCQ75368.1 hypothetical protein E6P09_08855 [Haloferax mediterranei ATCC 33500]